MISLSASPAWGAMLAAAQRLQHRTLRLLFAEQPDRFEALSLSLDDLLLDFSKQRVDAAALVALRELARDRDVEGWRDRLFAGAHINSTEDRAVLHVALRGHAEDGFAVDGQPVAAQVEQALARMLAFAEAVRSGHWRGHTGLGITDVVNIGIGGSDLGPAMVCEALASVHDGPRTHFVSNVDGAQIAGVLSKLDPATTLFIIASKTFTTTETLRNAATARAWFLASGAAEVAIAKHFVALSTNGPAVQAFGIGAEQMFPFWGWVGGRYSVWSAIGLSVAVAIGAEGFRAFLEGARAMDRHFVEAPVAQNLPITLALVGVWNVNALGCGTLAVLPYAQALARLPAYLQQADMESNGKRVTREGAVVDWATGPVVFGEPGTNGQHAFYQLIHQGPATIPCEFVVPVVPAHTHTEHHDLLLANCFAQSEALAFGRTEAEAEAQLLAAGHQPDDARRLAPHKTFPGDRPSTTILFGALTPFSLGRLIALYEHKIFVQGIIWGVNSFDQWGVELGKVLAKRLQPAVQGELVANLDSSTSGLLAAAARLRGG